MKGLTKLRFFFLDNNKIEIEVSFVSCCLVVLVHRGVFRVGSIYSALLVGRVGIVWALHF